MEKYGFVSPYCLTLTSSGLHIDGHCGIVEYGSELISLKVKSKLVTLHGIKLKLAAMDEKEMLISGVIHYIELSEEGRHIS